MKVKNEECKRSGQMVERNKRMVGGRRNIMKRQRADEGAKGDFSMSFFVPFSLFLSRIIVSLLFVCLMGH